MPGENRTRRPAFALLAAGLVLVLGTWAGQGGREGGTPQHPPATPAVAGSVDAPATPPTPRGFEVGDLPGRVAPPGAGSPPVRLVIPAIGVATRLVRLGLEADGAMAVPADYGWAGWFAEGPAPGQVGPAVIAGHVDSRARPAGFFPPGGARPRAGGPGGGGRRGPAPV